MTLVARFLVLRNYYRKGCKSTKPASQGAIKFPKIEKAQFAVAGGIAETGGTGASGFLGLMTVDGRLAGMDRNDTTSREAASNNPSKESLSTLGKTQAMWSNRGL